MLRVGFTPANGPSTAPAGKTGALSNRRNPKEGHGNGKEEKIMQVTPETNYGEIAVNALTGLNAPSYEQLAEALERAQREIDEYGEENSDMGDRITELENGLRDALGTLNELRRQDSQDGITLGRSLRSMVEESIGAIDKLL